MKIDLDDAFVDEIVIQKLKDTAVMLRDQDPWHPEDRIDYVQYEAACLVLLSYFLTASDYRSFVEKEYGKG